MMELIRFACLLHRFLLKFKSGEFGFVIVCKYSPLLIMFWSVNQTSFADDDVVFIPLLIKEEE